ncbi:hypothetical protein SCP_0107030 [Sparassis crispa]|uniref:Uncharacterized protein n=1 Tax=Sparassis crispa TaxID=139825 RepID=A0A401G6M3_9APHY|nr:hypothetical protein SCP_0107030 [Sparassis crispa]GBE77821.1 hypothetical protein SCP_0107030 [Sparassis crispa]
MRRQRPATPATRIYHDIVVQWSYQSREEDPFSLTDFFPQANLPDSTKGDEWLWLQYETSGRGSVLSGSRLSSPISEEDEEDLPPPRAEEEDRTREITSHEDQIVVLALDSKPMLPEDDGPTSDDRLLSPYPEEDSPDDDEALYNVLSALRRSYSRPHSPGAGDEATTLNRLFSEKGEDADDLELGEGLVHRGMCRVFDLLDVDNR